MKILLPGIPEKTGLQKINCVECQALLEITKVDIRTRKRENSKYSYFYISCPECGEEILVEVDETDD
jgi:RNase P subunit RPR2